jgi:Secretion system C-terminal sorting domain
MKIKSTLLLILVTCLANAQTLTYSAYSSNLTGAFNVIIADNSTFNPLLLSVSGTGAIWNASSLLPQSGYPVIHFQYSAPSSTPNGSLFPLSNYAQYDPALTSVLQYDYYNFSADSLVMVGEYSPSGAHEIYQNPDKHLIFPFSYNQSFTDSYAKTNYSNATTVSSYQTGTRTVQFNGYGTLILPQGTISDVGMITEIRTNNLGPNSTDITWIKVSSGKPLMKYSENAGDVTIGYNADLNVSVNEYSSFFQTEVSPNPCREKTFIHLNNVLGKNAVVEVLNMLGKTVLTIKDNSSNIEIPVTGLASGYYSYRLLLGESQISTGKIIVE